MTLLLSSFMNVISVNYDEMDKYIGSAFMQLSGTFADSYQFMLNPKIVK